MTQNPVLNSILAGKVDQLPLSEKESFLYLLGLFARTQSRFYHQERRFERHTKDKRILERIIASAENIGTRPPRVTEDEIRIYDVNLTRALETSWSQHFFEIVSNESDRILFLNGFFDNTRGKVTRAGATISYQVHFSMPADRMKLLATIFELDIYPCLAKKSFHIEGAQNIAQFQKLNADLDPERRQTVAEYLAQKAFYKIDLNKYYAFRRAVEQKLNAGTKPRWPELHREFQFAETTMAQWTADLYQKYNFPSHYHKRTPRIISNYEAVCAELRVPNVFLTPKPVRRYEKIFFPDATGPICMPKIIQQEYLAQKDLPERELTEEDIQNIWYDLRHRKDQKTQLGVKDRSITRAPRMRKSYVTSSINPSDITYKPITITFLEKNYVLPPRVQEHYFLCNGLTPEPFTPDHYDHLRRELQKQLTDEEDRDLEFTIGNDLTIENIQLRE